MNISVTVSPIKDAADKVIGASKVARDLTSIKKAERAMAYHAAIIESSDDAIISKDLNGFITSWNKSAERIFGYSAEEVMGRHITLIIPAERLVEEEKILVTLKTGDRIDHFETMRRHKDGHLVPVSLTVSPIRDAHGNIVGASKISRDISERVNAETLIREMSRKKDDFIANMSHELRTPMNAVIGLSHLLQASKTLSDKDRKFIDTLKISAESLMELINDLLDFAKIDSEAMQLEEVEFNFAEQLQKIISVMQVKTQEKGIGLNIQFLSPMCNHYLGDPLRIHQILTNLVSNAIKFTNDGSVNVIVESNTEPAGKIAEVVIKVVDTGIGIDKEKYDLIFEKFTQADSSISRRYGGSGLGLAITKTLVEKMGGSIGVESNLGIGTTFTVRLPLQCSDQSMPLPIIGAKSATKKNATRKNVLLVEDYEPNVMVASEMLNDLGYNFDVTHNGLEAVRAFIKNEYDVILMDVQMHELDGLTATERIRQLETEKQLPRTPIIAMTAHVREQDQDKCTKAGMDGFIPKPFAPIMLSEILARFIPDKDLEEASPLTLMENQ